MTRREAARHRLLVAIDGLDDDALVRLADMAEAPDTIPLGRDEAPARAKALARDVLEQARRHFRGEA